MKLRERVFWWSVFCVFVALAIARVDHEREASTCAEAAPEHEQPADSASVLGPWSLPEGSGVR